ncbi:MAG: hypothetical protein ASARMPREDX12_000425 [Alectoria sarmentosa]|nr:MAG: hypothetical protein ASARMPREDX12_000425 [Alectoria sarmentosa]
MAANPYISPYTVDERLHRSVMAAQLHNHTIHELHERESRRSRPSKHGAFKPDFNGDSFSGALGTITVVIEGLCFEGAEGWTEVQMLMPERRRLSSRLFGAPSAAPILFGNDRATLSLYDPLENLEEMLKTFLNRVEAWANKPKYFKEVTLPFIIRTIENSTSEASTAEKLRENMIFVGPIDTVYVKSFDSLYESMQEPILELRSLGGFIASILQEGDEISPHGTPKKPTLSKSSLSRPSSHFGKILSPVAEESGSSQPVETKGVSTPPTSSPYVNTIVSPEPATQAFTGGNLDAENTRGRVSTGFEDLLEAAGYSSGSNKKSPSPEREPERESTVDPLYPGSPSYSPPPSPSFSVDTLINPFSVPWITVEETSRDVSSSILLQPSSLHHIKSSPAPPGTPHWKIDLSERKGHPVHILHVGPRELDILAKCLTLVQKATFKGEECMRVIIEMKTLATEMEREYNQWYEFCMDLEDNVSIDEREAREKMQEEPADAKVDDDKGKGKGKDSAVHSADAYGADAYAGNDWFGTADSSDYGRLGSQAAKGAFGYRKLDPPSTSQPARRGSATRTDPDETEDEDDRGAPRDFGMGSPMSDSHRSSGTEGVEVVTNFEEAFAGDEQELDQEMLDVGGDEEDGAEQDEEADKGMRSGHDDHDDDDEGKKGLQSGGRAIGLYGELL